jgi:hypothetical protein
MINVQADKQCCHCEQKHQSCVMFLTEYKSPAGITLEAIPCFVCTQCLADAFGVILQLHDRRNFIFCAVCYPAPYMGPRCKHFVSG